MENIYSCEIKKIKNFYLKNGIKDKKSYSISEDYDTLTFGGQAFLHELNKDPYANYFTFNRNAKMYFDKIYVKKTIFSHLVKEIITGKYFFLSENDNTVHEINECNVIKPFVVNKNSLKKITMDSDKEVIEKLKSYLENKEIIINLINEIRCAEDKFYNSKKEKIKVKEI